MPERSFGRTVRYRRTKLGLSQASLGELVGRSTATIRSWERDKTRPTDPKVLATLAAILGVNERQLFDKAEVERPEYEETSPTVEEALATLTPQAPEPEQLELEQPRKSEPSHLRVEVDPTERQPVAEPEPEPEPASKEPVRELVGAHVAPAYVAPPDPYVRTPATPTLTDPSYMEERSQRQLYRVRTLATIVALVALVVAFLWGIQEGLGAFGDWWDDFFGNLRL